MKQTIVKRKPFIPQTPREAVSIFRYQLFSDGKFHKVYLSDEEAEEMFERHSLKSSNVANKSSQKRGLSQ